MKTTLANLITGFAAVSALFVGQPALADDPGPGYWIHCIPVAWALAFLAAYAVNSIWANWYFFGTNPISVIGALVAAVIALPCACLMCKSRAAQAAITIAYLLLTGISYVILAPAVYQ